MEGKLATIGALNSILTQDQFSLVDSNGGCPSDELREPRAHICSPLRLHEAGALLGFGEAVVKDDDMMGYRPPLRRHKA